MRVHALRRAARPSCVKPRTFVGTSPASIHVDAARSSVPHAHTASRQPEHSWPPPAARYRVRPRRCATSLRLSSPYGVGGVGARGAGKARCRWQREESWPTRQEKASVSACTVRSRRCLPASAGLDPAAACAPPVLDRAAPCAPFRISRSPSVVQPHRASRPQRRGAASAWARWATAHSGASQSGRSCARCWKTRFAVW